MECISLQSKAVLKKKKRQKLFWEALISTFLLACWLRQRCILVFFPFDHRRGWNRISASRALTPWC